MSSSSPGFVAFGHFAMRVGAQRRRPRESLYEQIERAAGDDAAEKLVADLGGRRLYIPQRPAAGDLLACSIGLDAALRMAREFGGDRLLIPTVTDRGRRRVRIVAMRADDWSISQIAHELRCTQRYVYKVLADFHLAQQQNRFTQSAAHAAPGEK